MNRCPITGCDKPIRDDQIMCGPHMNRVPDYWRARFSKAIKARRSLKPCTNTEKLARLKEYYYTSDCAITAVNRIVKEEAAA